MIAKFETNFNLLEAAIIQGDAKSVELLLKSGYKLDWDADFPAYSIIRHNHTRTDILLLLIEYGQLNPDFRNKAGRNFLFLYIIYAVENKNDAFEIAKKLVDYGVSVQELDEEGRSSLHVAAGNNYDKIVELILTNGVEVNVQSYDGWTALHTASYYNRYKIINLLLQRGADVSVINKNGKTPFSLVNPHRSCYNESIEAMVNELSKLSFKNLPISDTNLELIETTPAAKEYFLKCTAELNQMSNIKFYDPHSYFTMLKMSKNVKKLSCLTKNEDFVTNFKAGINRFSCYKNELLKIFKEATVLRDNLDAVQFRLYLVFGDFFPDTVIRNLSKKLTLEDLPIQES